MQKRLLRTLPLASLPFILSVLLLYLPDNAQAQAPANDNCVNAITLTPGNSCTPTNGTTVGATQSLADNPCGGTSDDDVWYKFTATATAHAITVVGNGDFDAIVDIRSGACNGANIACADDAVRGGTETAVLGLAIGSTYYVRVYSFGSMTEDRGTFSICVAPIIPPSNDNCANAITLTPAASCNMTAGTTVNATQSLPAISCAEETANADDDVWYKFTATATSHTITLDGRGYDVLGGYYPEFEGILDVRSGNCNGTSITCGEPDSEGITTVSLGGLTIGTTFYVRVYSYGGGMRDRGAFKICVSAPPPPPPANDESENANLLSSCTTGTTMNATPSMGSSCGVLNAIDVWYKLRPDYRNHTLTVVGNGSFDPVVEVIRTGGFATTIACANATGAGGTETVNLTDLSVGVGNLYTYYVRVSGTFFEGTFTICLNDPPSPPNNDCSNAITLTSGISCTPTAGTTIGANGTSSATGSCGGIPDDDVWYKFTAVTTSHTVTVVSEDMNAVVDVRSGTCNSAIIACSVNGQSETAIMNLTGLTVGSTYYVRVYSAGGDFVSPGGEDQGIFTICITHTNDDCGGAITLISGTSCAPITGSTVNATQSLPALTCNAITGSADDDVWYKFTAAATSHSVKAVAVATFNPILDIRSGACNGTSLGCIDATSAAGTETINLSGLSIGTTYHVRVYGRGSTAADRGSFQICVTHVDCPASLTVTESITGGTVLKNAAKITATNQVSGGIVTYRGAQSVTLQPGFRAVVSAGSLFQAMIGECP